MENNLKCTRCGKAEQPELVTSGQSGGLWGPFWYCDECDAYMDKELEISLNGRNREVREL